MDNKIVSILEQILSAIEEGRVSIYIGSEDGYEQSSEPELPMLPMLAANLGEYIKEEQSVLNRQLVAPLAICENGDVLIRTTEKGLQHYKDNKEELYTNIYLKCGASRIYVYAYDVDECWVQYEKSSIVKDIGQIPDFGTQPMNNEQEQTQQEETLESLESTPLLTLTELAENMPEALTEIKLHVSDIGQIMQIMQNRLTVMTFENIETLLYEREED